AASNDDADECHVHVHVLSVPRRSRAVLVREQPARHRAAAARESLAPAGHYTFGEGRMNASVDDVKEFVAENQQAAVTMAESFLRTSGDQLEYWVVPPSFRVSGLGERVILIAAPRGERTARPQESRGRERERVAPEREGRRDGGRDRGPGREPRRERARD